MDIEQAAKTIQWLDDERRKDKQAIAALQERLSALAATADGLSRRLQQMESEWTASAVLLKRLAKVDDILDGARRELTKQLGGYEGRRAEAEKEAERLRKVERDTLNKTLAELRKGAEIAIKMDREAQIRREEEARISRLANDLQKKRTELTQYMDDRGRAMSALEEGRRLDNKRLADMHAELTDLRKRMDEARGRLDIAEDLARRNDVRLGELLAAENERRAAHQQRLDAQALAQAERDRAWSEIQAKAERAMQLLDEYSARMTQYAETHREMKRVSDEFQQALELIERRITEVTEIQRLAEERFRQDWAAFLADDQKRWTTHMLLRDEQWRDHDRLNAKQLERLDTLEEQVTEAVEAVHHLQANDASRMQMLLNALREWLAEYDQTFTKVR